MRGGGAVVVEVRAASGAAREKLAAVPGAEEVEILSENDGWTSAKVFAKAGVDVRDPLYDAVRREGWALREMSRHRATLEDVFVELTQD